MSGTTESKLDQFPTVQIDPEGVFKYVLIEIYEEDKNGKEIAKLLVRGDRRSEYHADIFDPVDEKVRAVGLDTQCLGGGRIKHDPSQKKIDVYGYSVGFGKADHTKTVEKLKEAYPNYTITWSDEGY